MAQQIWNENVWFLLRQKAEGWAMHTCVYWKVFSGRIKDDLRLEAT